MIKYSKSKVEKISPLLIAVGDIQIDTAAQECSVI